MDVDAYSNHISKLYSSGVVMINMAVGQKMGLFKLLCDADVPLTSQKVADKANMKERYVREWLNCMVTAQLLQLDMRTGGYYVTTGHKKTLSKTLPFAPVVLLMSERVPALIDCFNKDGPFSLPGVSTSFLEWMDEYRSHTLGSVFNTDILPFLQKHSLIRKLEAGESVIDIGCGPGNCTHVFAEHFPKSNFIGVDFDQHAVNMAAQRTVSLGLSNAKFQHGDAHNLPEAWTGVYDLVIINDVLHDLPDPYRALRNVHRILKPEGILFLYELGVRSNLVDNIGDASVAMLYGISVFFCLPSSMSADPRIGYGACWGIENMEKALSACNFNIKDKCRPSDNTTDVMYLCTKAQL